MNYFGPSSGVLLSSNHEIELERLYPQCERVADSYQYHQRPVWTEAVDYLRAKYLRILSVKRLVQAPAAA